MSKTTLSTTMRSAMQGFQPDIEAMATRALNDLPMIDDAAKARIRETAITATERSFSVVFDELDKLDSISEQLVAAGFIFENLEKLNEAMLKGVMSAMIMAAGMVMAGIKPEDLKG